MTDDSQHKAFLEQIAAQPSSDEPRLIYADWLEEHQDIRAQYLRAEIQFANEADIEAARLHLEVARQLAKENEDVIEPEWIELAGTRFDYVLHSFGNFKLDAVKYAKSSSGLSLMDAKKLVESELPQLVVAGVTLNTLTKYFPNQFENQFSGKPDSPVFEIKKHVPAE